nr:hypothetical protein [uncultured Acetatifactor sp.]
MQIWQDIRRTMRMPDIASPAERAGRRIRQGQQGSPCDSPRADPAATIRQLRDIMTDRRNYIPDYEAMTVLE